MIPVPPDALAAFRLDIAQFEAYRAFAYDDESGKTLEAGVLVEGNATIGYGRNLSQNGISIDEGGMMLKNDLTNCFNFLSSKYSWFNSLTLNRQRGCMLTIYNTGNAGFAKFADFIAAMQAGNYVIAAGALLDSKAAKELTSRYAFIANLIKG